MREPARTIAYRHACNCATANRPPGEHPEHRFDVDGAPFPWLITEAGATFKRLGGLTSVYNLRLKPMHPARLRRLRRMLDATRPRHDCGGCLIGCNSRGDIAHIGWSYGKPTCSTEDSRP